MKQVEEREHKTALASVECHDTMMYQENHLDVRRSGFQDLPERKVMDTDLPKNSFIVIAPTTISGVHLQLTKNPDGFYDWKTVEQVPDLPDVPKDDYARAQTEEDLKDGRQESFIVFVPLGSAVVFPGRLYHSGNIRVPQPLSKGDPDPLTRTSPTLDEWAKLAKKNQYRMHYYVFDNPADSNSKLIGPEINLPPNVSLLLKQKYRTSKGLTDTNRFFKPSRFIMGDPDWWKYWATDPALPRMPPVGFHRNLFATDPEEAFGLPLIKDDASQRDASQPNEKPDEPDASEQKDVPDASEQKDEPDEPDASEQKDEPGEPDASKQREEPDEPGANVDEQSHKSSKKRKRESKSKKSKKKRKPAEKA